MKTRNRAQRSALLVCACAAIFVAACSVSTTKGDLAPRIARFESELSRGKSTKADVLLIMGQPDGAGAAALSDRFAAFDWTGKPYRPGGIPGQDEVWFFLEYSGGLTAGNRRVLLVYFHGEVLDGYQWFANKFDVHLH
jgi:hypothetical protein